jgi:hypothetical protein
VYLNFQQKRNAAPVKKRFNSCSLVRTIGKRYWVRANGVMAAESETRRKVL